jgi:magnesium chelatase family protein
MLSKVKCIAFRGLHVVDVDVEVSISTRGLPQFNIVGLPNKSVEESKHRIKSAFLNSGIDFPACKITVNLAPADLNKIGSAYDLPIAVGIFCAKNNVVVPEKCYFFGELSLDGLVRQVRGSYLLLDHLCSDNTVTLYMSPDSLDYFEKYSQAAICGVSSLREVVDVISGGSGFRTRSTPLKPVSIQKFDVCIDDIVGQDFAKRALLISASGGHNLMLLGSPGTGKTMLAKSVLSILPVLSNDELSQLRKIYSYVGKNLSDVVARPFRNPHHTLSYSAMLGGGRDLLPGEVTLAHCGILFMDEFAEFSRNVIEALRQPMQDGEVTITRNNVTYSFPSKFTLLAAANRCPCGYLGHPTKICTCSAQRVAAYSRKLSGPVSDRFDLFVSLYPEESFSHNLKTTDSRNTFKSIVATARDFQSQRLKKYDILCNSFMDNKVTLETCLLDSSCRKMLDAAYSKMQLSPRVYFKLIKVARTIADIEQSPTISTQHLAEALQYRHNS